MNKRLLLIAENIENGKGVIDVGTDHGYLPVYLAKNEYSGNIFASDINQDPLNKAKNHAQEAEVQDRIKFFLCDGLQACPRDEIDTIVIAGMGGDMIVKILDEGYWCMDSKYKLILQPMSKVEVLRYWLAYNDFEINKELLVDENNTLYQIIVTRFGAKTKHNDAELYTGKATLAFDSALYRRHFDMVHKRFERAVSEMKSGDLIPQYRLAFFEDVLEQLEEMEKKL